MITKEQFLNIDKSNIIELTYKSPVSGGKTITLKPISKPRYSEKYKLYKLTLKNVKNIAGAKYYAYLRNGNDNINFAYSDSPILVNEIKIH